ncbi:amidohydrolase [Paracoccus sp. WLY502]|uniref:amidohydrolase n=1 Tax=Paracoccus yibinensis TaxID=3068891 RepID=UPI002796648A|nr:amidohydrolase [Paracoccus sp. WLY502]MDQ1901632.1 amidohydrolase [Paracoccus sp. WLY502]
MRRREFLATLAAATAIPGLGAWAQGAAEGSAAIYHGGDILTMAGDNPAYVEAVLVQDARIAATGSLAEVRAAAPAFAVEVDLGGRTMLPGFIDAHGHLPNYVTSWGQPNLSPPPVGKVSNIATLLDQLRKALARETLKPGAALIGSGYDDSLLAEGRHPTRAELDSVSAEVPIIARHASGHLMVVNSAALALAGITRDTPDPDGGVMRRDTAGELTGVVEENAMLPFLNMLARPSHEDWVARLDEIQTMYAGYGLTTAADHLSRPDTLAEIRRVNAEGVLRLDLISYVLYVDFDKVLDGEQTLSGIEYFAPGSALSNMGRPTPPDPLPAEVSLKDPATGRLPVGVYVGHSKIAGIKIALDGSPQGKTAYLSEPYLIPPEGSPADYRGYPTLTQERLDAWMDAAFRNKVQLVIHCNGDAASAMMIDSVRKARATYGDLDLRPVMIHSQTARPDQLAEMKELGIIPSFFSAHTFYWGDWHRDSVLGPERAARISAMATADRLGLKATNHTDSPIVPPDMMFLVWTAVNRVTRSGQVLGPEERVSPYVALKAITDHAAWQYFEEGRKGTIEPGKVADLVILDRNPLKVDPMEIKDIRVEQTLKDGETVFSAASEQGWLEGSDAPMQHAHLDPPADEGHGALLREARAMRALDQLASN